jgi:hypothetical protein
MSTYGHVQYRIEQAILHPDTEENIMNRVALLRKHRQSMMRDRYLSILFLGIVFLVGCIINFYPHIIPGDSTDPVWSNMLLLFRFCFVLVILLQFERQVLFVFKSKTFLHNHITWLIN